MSAARFAMLSKTRQGLPKWEETIVESMMKLIGLGLAIGMVVAIGFYAWQGEWGAVVLAVGAAFIGQFFARVD